MSEWLIGSDWPLKPSSLLSFSTLLQSPQFPSCVRLLNIIEDVQVWVQLTVSSSVFWLKLAFSDILCQIKLFYGV